MRHSQLAFVTIIILLVAQAASASASPAVVNSLPAWEQANSNGFGDPLATEVTALEAFKGNLYAGIHSDAHDALIYRSPNGTNWTPVIQPGFGISHDIAPRSILDFIVFNNRLYVTTGRTANAAQIYRSLDGSNWAPMTITGFSNPDNVDIGALAVYDGMIYAGVRNRVDGARIYRSSTGDNNTWGQVAPLTPGSAPAGVNAFAEFNGALYATIESEAPAQIWEGFGLDWTEVMTDGFGSDTTIFIGGMAVFGNYLYAGAGDTVDGARLLRSLDGAAWDPVTTPIVNDANNQAVESLFVFQHQLYASVKNSVTGMELWRSADGATWEQVNPDGFGDSANTATNFSNASTEFQCQLYVGTLNAAAGGELWRIQQECTYLPLIFQ